MSDRRSRACRKPAVLAANALEYLLVEINQATTTRGTSSNDAMKA